MLNTSILVNATDTKFKSKALADFTQSIADKYGTMIAFIEQFVINLDEDIFSNYFELSNGIVSGLTDSFSSLWHSHLGVNLDSLASFNFGYMNWRDVIIHIARDLYNEDEEISLSPSMFLSVNDADGNVIGYAHEFDVINAIQMNYHSTVAYNAAVSAVSEVSTSDRLTVFRDKLASTFSDAYADFSGSINRYLDILSCPDSSIALDNLIKDLSLDQLSQDNNAYCKTLSETKLGKYTGANPMASYDMSNVGSAIVTVGRVAAKVIKGAISSLINLGSRLVRKAANIVKANTSNPVDLKVINDAGDACYSIDQFCWNDTGSFTFLKSQLPSVSNVDVVLQELNEDAEYVYKYKFISGEILFSFNNISGEYESVAVDLYKIAVKPYILDPAIVAAIANSVPGMHCEYSGLSIKIGFTNVEVENYEALTSFYSKLSSARPYLDVTNENEDLMYLGLKLGAALTSSIIEYGYQQMINSDPVEWASSYNFIDIETTSDVTNEDFLRAASGYNGTGFSFGSFGDGALNTSSTYFSRQLFRVLVAQKMDQYNNPLDYCFVPYQKGVDSFELSRFAIKTDQENYEATTKFLDGVVAFALLAVAAIAIGVTIKAVSNQILKKALQTKSILDNKMWSGEKLTASELRLYKRATKRSNILSSLSGNIRKTDNYNSDNSEVITNSANWLNNSISDLIK